MGKRGLTRREWGILGGVVLGLFAVMQLLPVGAPRDNPVVVAEPPWDSPRTRELFYRTCGDCHSNATVWPWYSRLAPVSWLVASDVANGRRHLNVSEWHLPQRHADEAAEELREGEMPLPIYLVAHPEAKLGPAEKAELLAGLEATFGVRERDDGERGRNRGGNGSGR